MSQPFIELVHYRSKKHFARPIRRLYQSAFPREEKMPYWLITKRAKRDNVNYWALVSEGQLVGLSYALGDSDLIYVYYLAILPEYRGQGLGSLALEALRKHYAGKRIVLNIEPVDEVADNHAMRVRRKQFYLRNGFVDLHYKITEIGVNYEMLQSGKLEPRVTREEYMALMRRFFGPLLYRFIYRV